MKSVAATTVARLSALPAESIRLLDLAHVMVAEAEQEPSPGRAGELPKVMAEVSGEHAHIVAAFDAHVESLNDPWWETWGAATAHLLAIWHPWFVLEELAGGALHRRIDAIYDGLGTPFCAHEVQTRYLDLLGGLSEAAESGTTKALKFAASLGLGFAGGVATAHGLPGMPVALRASEWMQAYGKRAPDFAYDLARVLSVWLALPEAECGGLTLAEAEMTKHCQEESRKVPGTSPDGRMWVAALEVMNARLHEGVAMPNFVGLTLDKAEEEAAGLGIRVTTVDGARRGDASRDPWLKANWEVIAQHPPADAVVLGEHLVLIVVKPSEPRLNDVQSMAEVKHRALTLGL